MKIIFKYLKEYKKEAILGPFFKLLEAVFDLMVPIIVSCIIDNGISNHNKAYIIKMFLLLCCLTFLGITVSIIAQYFAAKASVKLGSKLREKLYEHVQSFSYKELDKVGESTIINRITSDTLQVQSGVNLLLRLALRSPFIVFGSLIMAFIINSKMSIIFLCVIGLICFVIFIITKINVPKYKIIQDKKDNILNITKENLSGARVIRAFGIEEDEYNEFKMENEEYTIIEEETSIVSSSMHSLNYLIINTGIMFLIYYGGIEVNIGTLSQGQVVALYNYMSQILIEILKLTNLLLVIPKTFASSRRIEDILEINGSIQGGEKKLDGSNIELELEKVDLNYNDTAQNNSLINISFKIKSGESLGIIGGTGAGKTSIINLIPRLYDCTSGKIKINGNDIKEYDLKNLRENIGIVTQNKVLFKGTIEENIKFGNNTEDKNIIENAIQISQVKEFIERKKDGLKEIVEEQGKNFSGGQKQRISIARVLAKNPKILILDDSMSALDLATDKKIRAGLEKIKENRILIIVSQRVSTIKNLDKIIVVDEGKIVGEGTHNELLENNKIYREIYDTQIKNS